MELECIKYNEKMRAENAICLHPTDYCKYRTSCMIQFISSENKAKKVSVKLSDSSSPEEKSNNKK